MKTDSIAEKQNKQGGDGQEALCALPTAALWVLLARGFTGAAVGIWLGGQNKLSFGRLGRGAVNMGFAILSPCTETQLRVLYEPVPVGFHFGYCYRACVSLAQTAMQQKPTAISFFPTYFLRRDRINRCSERTRSRETSPGCCDITNPEDNCFQWGTLAPLGMTAFTKK